MGALRGIAVASKLGQLHVLALLDAGTQEAVGSMQSLELGLPCDSCIISSVY